MNTNASRDSEPAQPAELRRKAEDRLRASEARPAEVTSVTDACALVHELQVHQIELEMQNEELQRARMEAEEASEKYYDLFDFAPVGHFLWDHEGRILEVNLAGAALLGLDRSVASQKRFGQFVASEYRARVCRFPQAGVGDRSQANLRGQAPERRFFGLGAGRGDRRPGSPRASRDSAARRSSTLPNRTRGRVGGSQ